MFISCDRLQQFHISIESLMLNMFYLKKNKIGWYRHFQPSVTFTNLIPFIQIHNHKFETIIQNSCLMRIILFKNNQRLKRNLYISFSDNFHDLPNYTLFGAFFNKKSLSDVQSILLCRFINRRWARRKGNVLCILQLPLVLN